MSSSPTPPPDRRLRRRILLVTAVALGASIAAMAAVLLVPTVSNGEVSVLVGVFGSEQFLGLAVVCALWCIVVGLCAIPVTRWWLLGMVPARIAASVTALLGGFGWLVLATPGTVVPLLSDGCESGYVVAETSFLMSGSGTVYRQEGILVTPVQKTGGDDGYHPFHDGAYTVIDDGRTLSVWYDLGSEPSGEFFTPDGAADFVLPKITGRPFPCGREAGGTRHPLPPSPSKAPDFLQVDMGMREMLATTLTAAVGPVRTAEGDDIDPMKLHFDTTTCAEGAVEQSVSLALHTGNPAESLTRILAAWDAAGYKPDRAIQEDIRYSETLPVAKLTIRDTSTIDLSIHLTMTSQCASLAPTVD